MKRNIRVSSHHDYIAVDLKDDNQNIIKTPFYLTYKGMGKLKYCGAICSVFISDVFEQRLMCRTLTTGADFKIRFTDLLDEKIIEFIE